MVQTSFKLLKEEARFANADILWITDFRIPLAPAPLLQEMAILRSEHTRFYGLKIGTSPHNWQEHFDEILEVQWQRRMK